jgi:hypothetical protein
MKRYIGEANGSAGYGADYWPRRQANQSSKEKKGEENEQKKGYPCEGYHSPANRGSHMLCVMPRVQPLRSFFWLVRSVTNLLNAPTSTG